MRESHSLDVFPVSKCASSLPKRTPMAAPPYAAAGAIDGANAVGKGEYVATTSSREAHAGTGMRRLMMRMRRSIAPESLRRWAFVMFDSP